MAAAMNPPDPAPVMYATPFKANDMLPWLEESRPQDCVRARRQGSEDVGCREGNNTATETVLRFPESSRVPYGR